MSYVCVDADPHRIFKIRGGLQNIGAVRFGGVRQNKLTRTGHAG